MWIEGRIGIVITVGDLDIWLGIVETEESGIELGREEDWNMDKDQGLRKIDKVI